VALVQITHGRNKTYDLVFTPALGSPIVHRENVAENFHGQQLLGHEASPFAQSRRASRWPPTESLVEINGKGKLI
jgi:hypothetical protein